MRSLSLILAMTAVGGVAYAQPGPPPPPMDSTPNPPPDPPPPETTPVVQSSTTVQTQVQPTQTVTEEADGTRPSALAIGLGLGYSTPIVLDMPNISSLRLRLPSGLTFEPAVRISNTTSDQDNATGGEDTDKLTAFGLALVLRLPLVSRGKFDLEALGTIGFSNTKSNPEGDYNATTQNAFGLGYGVAVTNWLSPHWNLSFNITNPLIDYRQSKVQTGIPNDTSKSSDTTIGIIFNPEVFLMIHMYN